MYSAVSTSPGAFFLLFCAVGRPKSSSARRAASIMVLFSHASSSVVFSQMRVISSGFLLISLRASHAHSTSLHFMILTPSLSWMSPGGRAQAVCLSTVIVPESWSRSVMV